jgi:hypothetical protein
MTRKDGRGINLFPQLPASTFLVTMVIELGVAEDWNVLWWLMKLIYTRFYW